MQASSQVHVCDDRAGAALARLCKAGFLMLVHASVVCEGLRSEG